MDANWSTTTAGCERDSAGPSRHSYERTYISSGARAHLGDMYHFGEDNLLKHLPYAIEAPFNAVTRQGEPTCLPETRVDVLQTIYNWADGQDDRCIFWLNGLAGTGKSTISRTIARKYFEQERLGASFFFSRGGGGDVSHAGKFFTSIAAQLAQYVPPLQRYICEALTKHCNIASQSFDDQWRQLILHPLSKLDRDSCRSYVLVLDALDECDDENHVRIILRLLTEARSLKTARLRILITSRPETPIRHGFYQIPEAHQNFVLHNIESAIVDHDIAIFLEHNLNIIRQERCLDADWPGGQVIRALVRSASGLFIWAATACRFIREGKRFAVKRLATILDGSSTSTTAPEKHLDEIYITVLKHSSSSGYTDEENNELYSILRHLLGSIVVLFSPLSIDSLSRLLHIIKQDIYQTLEDLHAILDIPGDSAGPLLLHHPSFRDFLLEKDRCDDTKFWVDEKQAHGALTASCIRLMTTSLRQDICGLGAPGVLITDVKSSQVEQCLSSEVQYACLYWVQHLQKGGSQLFDNDQVHEFLLAHLLHWLEALSWMRKISEGILAIISLESITLKYDCPRLYTFVHDMKRFALYYRATIEQAPLQLYCSALTFAPAMSKVRKQFEDQVPRWVQRLHEVESDWSALLQTLEGHSSRVNAVAFSPDGKVLASASDDETVKLWDAGTGAVLQTLKGHSSRVSAVAFSPNGKVLASASVDETVKLWDASTGVVLQMLEGHSDLVNGVAFSPDGKVLASASVDQTVKLWDTGTGAVLQTLEGHSGLVNAVAFSPDGKVLASASGDRTVKLWNTGTRAVLQTLEGHSGFINAVAFSPDGKVLASASGDRMVKLWDAGTGAVLQTLKGHSGFVSAVAFSPDGKVLASASGDQTVKLWDAGTGVVLQTLEGHSSWVSAVAFSPDGKVLASASGDQTVKLWDAGTGAVLQTLDDHSSWVSAVAFSPDGKVLASASDDQTVKLWDASTGAVLQTLEGHSGWVNAVAFSPDGKVLASASDDQTVKLWDTGMGAVLQTLEGHSSWVSAVAFSPEGKVLASASGDRTVKLWDAGTGAVLQTLDGHSRRVSAVAFSPDGKVLASASGRRVELWDVSTGAVLQKLEGHSSRVSAVAFSPDGKVLASASGDQTVKLWDAGTGAVLQTLEGHSSWVNAVAFSPDGKVLASASVDETVKLWDAGTGAVLQKLEGHSSWVSAVAFSPDGKVLASASGDETVKLWDTGTGAVLQTLEGHSGWVNAVAFSPDGKVLASASGDQTVKLWDTGTGAVLQTLEGHSSWVSAVAFSPDGKVLASASVDQTVKLWDAGTGAVLQTLEGHSSWVSAVAFSPDGKVLASALGGGRVKLWDTGTGAVLQTLEGHSGWVNAVAFSPDGKVLASASDGGRVKLWDAGTGAVLQTLEGHSSRVSAVAFSSDGKVLASASGDRTVKLWDAGTGAVLQTFEVDAIIQTLSFSDEGTFLHTDRGLLRTVSLSHSAVISRPNLSSAIFVKGQWVSWGMENILWLPADHRPSCAAVYGSVIAMGHQSGRVSIFKVSPDLLPAHFRCG